jgi:hypothetical protein
MKEFQCFLVGYFNVSSDDYELDEMLDNFINYNKER